MIKKHILALSRLFTCDSTAVIILMPQTIFLQSHALINWWNSHQRAIWGSTGLPISGRPSRHPQYWDIKWYKVIKIKLDKRRMRLLMSGLVRRHRWSEFRNCDISGFVRPSNFNFNEISKWKETNIKPALLVRGYNHPQRYVSLVPFGRKKKICHQSFIDFVTERRERLRRLGTAKKQTKKKSNMLHNASLHN